MGGDQADAVNRVATTGSGTLPFTQNDNAAVTASVRMFVPTRFIASSLLPCRSPTEKLNI